MSKKRKDYISWDEYFMGVAELSAMRSKDPKEYRFLEMLIKLCWIAIF